MAPEAGREIDASNDATARKKALDAVLDDAGIETGDTAVKSNEQIERAVAKWRKLQPQFWTPLDESLPAIISFVNAN